MSKNYYFFCLSYTNVPAILAIIQRLDIKNENVTIVVTIESHNLFWQELVESNKLKWKILYLTTYPGRHVNPLTWIKARQLIKQLFKKNFQNVLNSNVYFFSSSYSLVIFSLIKKLSRRSFVYFLDCDKRRYPSFYNIKSIAYLILGNLVYNIEIKIVNVDDKPVPTLSYRFFKNRNIKNISAKEYPYDTNILSGYNLDNGEVPKNKRIVLLDDQCNISSSHSRMELSIILRKLKEIIKSNFSQDQVLFKRHPNPEFYSKEFDSIYSPFSEYPYYIPADFIFLHPNIRFVIGGFSTTLATASKYDNIRSISYIKLVPFNNEDYRNQIIKFLKSESEDKIFFPDSWDELNLLLKSISL